MLAEWDRGGALLDVLQRVVERGDERLRAKALRLVDAIVASATAPPEEEPGPRGDLEAVQWFAGTVDPGVVERLARLELGVERLVEAGAPAPAVRAAAAKVADLLRTIRARHRAAHEPAPGGPLVVGIADPCPICGGTAYRLPARAGWVECASCHHGEGRRR